MRDKIKLPNNDLILIRCKLSKTKVKLFELLESKGFTKFVSNSKMYDTEFICIYPNSKQFDYWRLDKNEHKTCFLSQLIFE